MTYSGGIQPLYGVVIRDKSKTVTDVETLMAYKVVAEDMLKGYYGKDAEDLRSSLSDLNQAIAKCAKK